jgi:predicted RNA-binding Zn ribbon-like protein
MTASSPPLLGEPLVVELANTRYALRGHELEGLDSPQDLADWLRRVSDRLPVALSESELETIAPADLAAARDLRDAVRTLVASATVGAALDPNAVETVNRIARAAPHWRELSVSPDPAAAFRTAAPTVKAALAVIAEDAMNVLSGSDAAALRACEAPGCILFFRKDHPRRTWCSARCANRVRSARHYARRHRADGSDASS